MCCWLTGAEAKDYTACVETRSCDDERCAGSKVVGCDVFGGLRRNGIACAFQEIDGDLMLRCENLDRIPVGGFNIKESRRYGQLHLWCTACRRGRQRRCGGSRRVHHVLCVIQADIGEVGSKSQLGQCQ